jgi:hypothetical protein
MKKILLIALLLTVPFIGFSQTTTKPITGFLGIKFGSSKLAVIAAMKAKGAVLDKKHTSADGLAFNNVKLGLRTADAFLVRFVNNKAFEADYIFHPELEAKVIPEYDDLVADIVKVYGDGQVTKDYTSPYAEGDGNTLLGLSAGKIDFHTVWFDASENEVSVTITTDMSVQLQYQSDALTKEAVAHQDAKQKGDF